MLAGPPVTTPQSLSLAIKRSLRVVTLHPDKVDLESLFIDIGGFGSNNRLIIGKMTVQRIVYDGFRMG